jgi:hypothetical protein
MGSKCNDPGIAQGQPAVQPVGLTVPVWSLPAPYHRVLVLEVQIIGVRRFLGLDFVTKANTPTISRLMSENTPKMTKQPTTPRTTSKIPLIVPPSAAAPRPPASGRIEPVTVPRSTRLRHHRGGIDNSRTPGVQAIAHLDAAFDLDKADWSSRVFASA